MFLHRCQQYELAPLPPQEASEALAEPIAASGGEINPDALNAMRDTASGHPYMVQPTPAGVPPLLRHAPASPRQSKISAPASTDQHGET